LSAQVLGIAQAPRGHGDTPTVVDQMFAQVPTHKAGAAQDQYSMKSINHVVQGKKLRQIFSQLAFARAQRAHSAQATFE
jgi:hypothetical protein